jgi:hypothetical protein
MLYVNATASMATDAPWTVAQFNGDIPQRHMFEMPLGPDIAEAPWLLAASAKWSISSIRHYMNLDGILGFSDGFYLKPL